MECELVHTIPGRVRIRVTDAALLNGLASAFTAFLAGRPGIRSVKLNRNARSVVLTCDPGSDSATDLVSEVQRLTVEELRANGDETDDRPDSDGGSGIALALSSAALACGLFTEGALITALVLGAAVPIFNRAIESLREKGKLNVDVLDAAATTVLAAQGRIQTAAVMVWLVALGDVIRDLTVHQSHRAIEELFDGKSRLAWVVRDGRKAQVEVGEIEEGDEVVVYPGELIPVDGTVLAGRALVDEKTLTGESNPVEKNDGASVYAATVVSDGKLYLRAAKVGPNTLAAKIVQFVRDAPVRQTRIQNYAEQFADRVVPWSFLGAGAALGLSGVNTAASLLIIDYGTGIRVAAPTTVLASITRAARHGILIKGGRHLERLAEVDAVIFDKTGTLTRGTPEVIGAHATADGLDADTVLAIAAAAEERLTHPVARAIVRAARERGLGVPERDGSEYAIGLGVEASVGGAVVHVGSDRLMALKGIDVAPAHGWLERIADQAASPVFVGCEGELLGVLAYADPLRPEAPTVVQALRERGIVKLAMVTGDQPEVARRVAEQLGIDDYLAGALPEQKVECVRSLQREGRVVAVVGDGINDSPALTQADVGISVRGGSDVARVAAHVALLEGNLWKVVQAIDVARDSIGLIRQNWDLLFYPNSGAIALSLLGVIGPVGATLISNGSAVAASLNALRPLLDGR